MYTIWKVSGLWTSDIDNDRPILSEDKLVLSYLYINNLHVFFIFGLFEKYFMYVLHILFIVY